jgi:osomolarity two-component system response regulator SSK1
MAGPILPSVRLPVVASGERGEGDNGPKEVPIVDLPPSNKFGIAWPPDVQPTDIPMFMERPIDLSSSDTETDTSEDAPGPGSRAVDEYLPESERTPTNRMEVDHDPIGASYASIPLPRLSRAFSMPISSQLGHLKNPRRIPSESSDYVPSPVIQLSSDISHLQELSLELADSVQLVAQTLLQLSPPQVLDPAKEQFSACSISIPTPCISAMFTTVKNLNYMSANMAAFSTLPSSLNSHPFRSHSAPGMSIPEEPKVTESDFDIAEMLQSVGDAISGLAAEAGVDVILYHGDVGMRHIAVRADECGVSYTLTHVRVKIILLAF